MNSKLSVIFFRIWIWASIINALLSAIVLCNNFPGFIGGFILTLICSLIFSIPIAIGTLLLSYLFVSLRLIQNIFLHVMLVCFICAGIGAWLYSSFLSEIDHNFFELCMCVVLSSVLAPLCCYKAIQRIEAEEADINIGEPEEEIFNNNSTTVL